MKLKYILAFLSSTISSATLAGGGGGGEASWQPSVSSHHCVVIDGLIDGPLTWSNDRRCNEAINNGYARGVRHYGEYNYTDGSKMRVDSVIVPYSSVKFNHKGKSVSHLDYDTRWVRN
ncbi:hypothetical protein G3142_005586 [Salmonella enterica subsp. enterica serovar Montevideo]|nr:hypothetical protein [Salmonella enterica subsp. enterica serovar Montevideo]EEK7814418.1 hypothetical protein [Salmonella enterica subsp. enterica serovar Montevideo]